MIRVKRILIGLFASCLTYQVAALDAKLSIEDLPALEQESQHALASKRIYSYFTRSHYKRIYPNDEFSTKVFNRYIRQLDFNKQFFLASDIDKLRKYEKQFDEGLENGNLKFAYEIFLLNQTRRYERYVYALQLLDQKMDFAKQGDAYYYDREDATWAQTEQELNEFWRQRVKYDALNLKLAGKEWQEIQELLSKRYNAAIKRITQGQSEDTFQLIMNAFARSIEAHTSYLSPRNADRFQMEMNLSLEGIGAVLSLEDDFTTIRSLVPGGPADRSEKLKPEDKIVGVGQKNEDIVDVIGWRLDDVVELIKGPKGTEVRLQILKGDSADNHPTEVVLIRDKIKLEDRKAISKVYTPEEGPNKGRKLGVIEIPSFYNNLTADVRVELDKLKEDKVEAVIVDLRGNGGGSLPESIMLSGLFIKSGPVVQVRDMANRIDVHKDHDKSLVYGGPLMVMIDRYSASASEIFAAAMQDYGRAIVIGENSFGKGTVQQHKSLNKRYDIFANKLGYIQYTFAKFYRINGGSTQHKGVKPDIEFPSPIDPAEWGEAKAENALPWDKIKPASYEILGSLNSTIAKLDVAYKNRIKSNPEFAYLYEDIEEYNKTKDRKFETLVHEEKIKRRNEVEAKRLQRANERLARLGKEPVKKLEDLPDDLNELDPLLDEAANITFDYIDLGKPQKLAAR
ncbi:carboxy terminal-processing peptidase [Saccharobesus litoralis]|uniref:Carboxy terminal-processing peptidase n=1 Tax=Saccharobesus litoralis TaxID=2172099 RepID=A0A2S0VU32_9ALTE|nr:carboxy terminal-processing peptidase [Saccharobesus litoralis]AWB67734.1 carboxy terminal-processing peptidase [Saccharobesus litoralis]